MRSHQIPLDGRPHQPSLDCPVCSPDVEQVTAGIGGPVVREFATHLPPVGPGGTWYGDWRTQTENHALGH